MAGWNCTSPPGLVGKGEAGRTAGENGEEGEATGFSHAPVPQSSLVPHSPAPALGNSLSQQAAGLRYHSPENRSVWRERGNSPQREFGGHISPLDESLTVGEPWAGSMD